MADLSAHMLIITSNVNCQNTTMQTLPGWIKNPLTYVLFARNSLQIQQHRQVKSKRWKKIRYAHINNNNNKKAVALSTSAKIDFIVETVTGDEDVTPMRESIPQEATTMPNVYSGNSGASKDTKQKTRPLKGTKGKSVIQSVAFSSCWNRQMGNWQSIKDKI